MGSREMGEDKRTYIEKKEIGIVEEIEDFIVRDWNVEAGGCKEKNRCMNAYRKKTSMYTWKKDGKKYRWSELWGYTVYSVIMDGLSR